MSKLNEISVAGFTVSCCYYSGSNKSEEGMSSPKRMRNESDDETSTVWNKDIFSSSDGGKSSEKGDNSR